MKLIAQEVRIYNKNGDEFQRVCFFFRSDCFWQRERERSRLFQTIEQFSVEQIEQRLALLDEIMEIELREVQNRFQSKRKPILEAIKLKKQTQTHH